MAFFKNRTLILLPHFGWKQAAGERPIYIFGSGEAGQLLIEYLRAVNIEPAGIVDNNKNKWGTEFLGLKIFEPNVLHRGIFVIIASCHYQEIVEQLIKLGLQKKIDFADDYKNWFKTLTEYHFVNNSTRYSSASIDLPTCIKEWVEKAGDKRFAVFGAGKFGKDIIAFLARYYIYPAVILDNDEKKYGGTIEGIPVKNLKNVEEKYFILVASSWSEAITQQLLSNGLALHDDFIIIESEAFYNSFWDDGRQKETIFDEYKWDETIHPLEKDVHFFLHNSGHAGDIILSRPFIKELRIAFPDARITLECPENKEYLWADLRLPIVIYNGTDYNGTEPTPNCPEDAKFINIWFGVFPDFLEVYGLSYVLNVHIFNRFMHQYHLLNRFQLFDKEQIPMVEFYRKSKLPFEIGENGILVENGRVFSGQSNFSMNYYLTEIARAFPNLNFYCSASPDSNASNIIDCSKMDLIDLSELSNHCVGFLTLGSGVNAATLTEINREKPRCIVGWNFKWKVGYTPENPVFFAENFEDVKRFLLNISQKIPAKNLSSFGIKELGKTSKLFCKFLRSKSEVEKCTAYLHENKLVSHVVTCKDWEIAHIISNLSDGNLLDMGSSDSYILKNAVIKGIRGQKWGIDLRKPNVPLASVKYLIGDLLNVLAPDKYFQNITCLSVLEHGVNIARFATEASRLLKDEGTLYVTFDYWEPKLQTPIKLYGLEWNIFSKNDVLLLIEECQKQGLYLMEEMDWTMEEPIINENYYAPAQIGYTFGMLAFKKMAKRTFSQNIKPESC